MIVDSHCSNTAAEITQLTQRSSGCTPHRCIRVEVYHPVWPRASDQYTSEIRTQPQSQSHNHWTLSKCVLVLIMDNVFNYKYNRSCFRVFCITIILFSILMRYCLSQVTNDHKFHCIIIGFSGQTIISGFIIIVLPLWQLTRSDFKLLVLTSSKINTILCMQWSHYLSVWLER